MTRRRAEPGLAEQLAAVQWARNVLSPSSAWKRSADLHVAGYQVRCTGAPSLLPSIGLKLVDDALTAKR